MSNYLTTDGLKKILYFRRPPEARGICHICHMVNPALQIPLSQSALLIVVTRFAFLEALKNPDTESYYS